MQMRMRPLPCQEMHDAAPQRLPPCRRSTMHLQPAQLVALPHAPHVTGLRCRLAGAGVLGLPNSLAWLGWVAGPICLCGFFVVTMCASLMLAKMYRTDGIEFSRYHHLVAHLLGRRGSIAVSVFQMLNLVLSDIGARACARVCVRLCVCEWVFSSLPLQAGERLCLQHENCAGWACPRRCEDAAGINMMPQWPLGAAYTITGAIAMQTIASYLHSQPTKQWQFSLILGALELVFSQVRWGHRLHTGAMPLSWQGESRAWLFRSRRCCAASTLVSPRACTCFPLSPLFAKIPSLEEIWWVSALGTLSSLGYVMIALGLGLAYSGNHEGSVGGRPGTSPANKAFGVLNA